MNIDKCASGSFDMTPFRRLYKLEKNNYKSCFVPLDNLKMSIKILFMPIILLEKYNIQYTFSKN